ncbi:hypothetical protein Lal_00049680 [Lupinus albus]|uniref:Uncharacterized protein n=1 Tax=Lupinus albus TaxID=3870 RepID=A0A6A4PM24_LUPAL|nr:hypothetical protein Lalb_Chr12g0200981 [Lupinus albus]KAF1867251.1 hypothetical protein Lal_00049680 [Lupinus albus]
MTTQTTTPKMAVTHADLEPSSGRTDLRNKTCTLLMVLLTILLGLFCFIMCLIAEVTRSEVKWMSIAENEKGSSYECVYNGSGKKPLLCAACAFVALAIVKIVEHICLLITVSKSSPVLLNLDPDSASVKSLTFQVGFFYTTTWICFAVVEILLLIGVFVESGHLKNWSMPRKSCLIIREGMFSSAAVFALITVFLASALCLTTLHTQRISQDLENVQWESSPKHVSNPTLLQQQHINIATVTKENLATTRGTL